MNPAETAAILRQFNEWRRGDEDILQFDPREIGEAIDAAIEMIGRLEAAERNLDCCRSERKEAAELFLSVKTKLLAERDALRAKIEAMEQQEPVGKFIQHPSNGMWEQDGYGDNPDARPLYAHPGAQPAPSVPEGWQLVPTAESMHPGIYKMLGALHAADNTPGMSERESYRAMLAAAPDAKP